MMLWTARARLSVPPPGPAVATNSIGLCGCQAAAAGSAQGKTLFTQQCGACHTLADAGTTQEVGPDLDKVLAGKSADFIRESIVNPNAEIASGFQPNIMPQDYGSKLAPQQLADLVAFLAKSTS